MRTARSMLSTVIAISLLAACTRAPSPGAGDDAPRATTGDPVATVPGNADASRELQDYYASLVAAHGEDLAQCGPAEDAIAGACSDGTTPEAAAAPRRVLLMLDASGSMAAKQGNQTKLQAAQDALLDFVRKLEGDAQVALRVYGHRGSNRPADKTASCQGTELVQAFGPRDAAAFETAVRSFQPRGFTPIAASLQAAAQDFASGGANASGNVVYVVSDGIETCDGDPAAAARALKDSDIKVVVNVIGFDVDTQAERQLRDVAEAGGGEYVTARTSSDLLRAFNQRTTAALRQLNCRTGEQLRATNRTTGSQLKRSNCLTGTALREYNAVTGAALRDFNADRASQAQYDYAREQARIKREAIDENANTTYDATSDAARKRLDATNRDARREYEAENAAAESDRGN